LGAVEGIHTIQGDGKSISPDECIPFQEKVNPVRKSSGAFNSARIILESNPAVE